MMGYGGYGLFGGLGMVIWIVIVALAIWALVALFNNRATRPEQSPLEILKRRYARGEISQAEFEQARRNLAQVGLSE